VSTSSLPARTSFRPADFRNPHGLKNKLGRAAWRVVWLLLFRPTPPRLLAGWRRLLVRLFGAKVANVYLHPSVRIWAPWKLRIGPSVWIDEHVNLYNPYGSLIGQRVVISTGAFLCTASHDHEDPAFALVGGEIVVKDDGWIAAEAFIGPGVTIADGAVIGARAVVVRDVEAWTVVAGNPARPVRKRRVRTP
jgi:putative colanic acid biosynthesis acetyltransferase WcaF